MHIMVNQQIMYVILIPTTVGIHSNSNSKPCRNNHNTSIIKYSHTINIFNLSLKIPQEDKAIKFKIDLTF